jgi:hypothetical protein
MFDAITDVERSPVWARSSGAIAAVLRPVMKRAMRQDLARSKAWVEDGQE